MKGRTIEGKRESLRRGIKEKWGSGEEREEYQRGKSEENKRG